MKLKIVEVRASPQKLLVPLQYRIFFLKWQANLFLINHMKQVMKEINPEKLWHKQVNPNHQGHLLAHLLDNSPYREVSSLEVYQFSQTFRSEPRPQECFHLAHHLVDPQALLQGCLAWSLLVHPQGYHPT